MLDQNEPPPSPKNTPDPNPPPPTTTTTTTIPDEFDSVLDVSAKSIDLSLSLLDTHSNSQPQPDALYIYKNVFNLLPKSLSSFNFKTLKFFANDVHLFPPEVIDLVDLQCLQLKLSPIGLSGLPFSKLISLKELELSKSPPRNSGFPILAQISALKALTKLSVCHFSIRYLPPEIGCLINLEYLDLSFNKMRRLPNEICSLKALISLIVANNKLVELPAGLSSLQRLENLDLSRNRLTSLGSLELSSMQNLRNLNLQYNKLLSCQIPAWISCNMDGVSNCICREDIMSTSVEMDVFETTADDNPSISSEASMNGSSYHLPGSSLSDRCFGKRRLGKRWKRRQFLQQRARQERLHQNRKWKLEDQGANFTIISGEKCRSCKRDSIGTGSVSECSSGITCVNHQPRQTIYENDKWGAKFLDNIDNDSVNSVEVLDMEKCNCGGGEAKCVGETDTCCCGVSNDMVKSQYIQQRACQQHLHGNRKWKLENEEDNLTIKSVEKCRSCKQELTATDSVSGCSSGITCDDDQPQQTIYENEKGGAKFLDNTDNDSVNSEEVLDLEKCNCVGGDGRCDGETEGNIAKKGLSSQVFKFSSKCKRKFDRYVDNPKPCKSRRSIDNLPDISRKYNILSTCSVEDYLPDGFYDAGRDRPFMSLEDYEENLEINSREVILLDRERDEELDAILLSARAMVSRFKKLTDLRLSRDLTADDNVLVALWLALFVSDHFGGSDKDSYVERVRKDVSGSNYCMPFVCTCATGNSENGMEDSKKSAHSVEDVALRDLCEKSLQSIKERRKSVVVPLGALQLGVCRHRAVLMKYLCDRMEPPIPCELIRGYLDFSPHAWNAILVQKNGLWVRMIVDACRPNDIRDEMDPEYLCRYIPLSRINSPNLIPNDPMSTCFPSISEIEEVEKAASSSIISCKVGTIKAAAKVRTLKVSSTSLDELRNFEYTCIGEVRILGALRKHPCIVEIYGHRISSEWITASSSNQKHDRRMLRSAIYMEYVEGGSLKNYIDKLLKAGEKHVPVYLALAIARDVSCALKELHSKHIIHRDIKSENILIDLNQKRVDGLPVAKLCDFDRAVPLRSSLHACCISHVGIPPPDICVGTPRWMAPEVLQTMQERKTYGLEVDIWSYGCLLLELLTLQTPYSGMPDSNIHDLLKNGERPPLNSEIELLGLSEAPSRSKSCKKHEEADSEVEILKFLKDVFRRCTKRNPDERPTADDLYDMLHDKAISFSGSAS